MMQSLVMSDIMQTTKQICSYYQTKKHDSTGLMPTKPFYPSNQMSSVQFSCGGWQAKRDFQDSDRPQIDLDSMYNPIP